MTVDKADEKINETNEKIKAINLEEKINAVRAKLGTGNQKKGDDN